MFLALAEELHFGRAADRVFVSQPALSRQIRALEELLGVALVERSTRRVRLTGAGQALLPSVRAAVRAADALREAAREASRHDTDRLVLGSYLSALPALRILFDALRRHDGAPVVEWRDVDNVGQVRALLDGGVDAVVCYAPVPDGVRTLRLGTEERYVCLPGSHPLADRAEVALAELDGLPVIGFSPALNPEWRAFWAADPRPGGAPVAYTSHAVTTLEACITHVGLGHGIRFIPASCRQLMPRPGIRYVAVSDLPPCHAVLAWSASRPAPPALAALLRVLRARTRTTAVGCRPDGTPGWWWETTAPSPTV
ncbi:LysR family transcriptional regulator [Streptomyces sudanensis]|uniref:LysR family transcriptional regulator n=1 Tax=Streptomyces sudanensis TaxID=436397 RepID=UPI0020CFC96F|nr:LysR substrate-binding domain-containing protein [Streptomyces sudanensis]MCP9958037.1 LysR substrate-binding domain-containing protein [Streptomyces sudanensis]MCQ0001436.1 LysR substrate-binding domain-containing protein [Streptomyces sudanensis]